MKKTNFTLSSNSLRISIVLMLFGFYSNFSHAQCPPFNFDEMFIFEPGVVCGELSPNMLANPSFEEQTASPELFVGAPGTRPPLAGWSTIGVGEFGWGTNMVLQNNFQTTAQDGNNHVKIFNNFGGPFQVIGMHQDFPAVAGETFAGSIYVQHLSGDPIAGTDNFSEVHIEYLDANGCLIANDSYSSSVAINGATPQDAWVKYSTVSTAPPGTATARFIPIFFGVNFNGGALFYDNASFHKVTGPLTMPITVDGGVADDLCMASVVVPPLDQILDVGGLFPPITFTNDFNGGSDASGDYRFGTTTVNVTAVNALGQESGSCPIEIVVAGAGTSPILACNDDVQISLDADACSLVNADMILEGDNYGCYDQYLLSRTPALSGDCGAFHLKVKHG